MLGLATFATTPLLAKGTKAQYKYQDTPKNGQMCADCMHFLADTKECRMVEGSIKPQGWCAAYYKQPQKK
nr:high-potential iron-sulfur protein [uncultured Sulfurimonas sp.]